MTNITIRWASPSDATINSTYKIRRTLNNVAWTDLNLSKASTTPYVSPRSTLANNTTYGASSITLVSATDFLSSGYGIIDDASILWTGKNGNILTGVTWKTGSGIYASTTAIYQAHESYLDSNVTLTNSAALYGITHIDGDGIESQENFEWFLSPPVSDSKTCTVIVAEQADLGFELRSGITISCELTSDTEFTTSGQHIDAATSSVKIRTTNAFGLAFFSCIKDKYRGNSNGIKSNYKFVLDNGQAGASIIYVSSIPDQAFALLSDLAD